jgi:hypothetical protein
MNVAVSGDLLGKAINKPVIGNIVAVSYNNAGDFIFLVLCKKQVDNKDTTEQYFKSLNARQCSSMFVGGIIRD